MSAVVIDVHAHAVLGGLFGEAGDHGPRMEVGPPPQFKSGGHVLKGVAYDGTVFMDPELRLERMAEVGIDYQVLSPNPLYFFHNIDAGTAASFARHHNELLAGVVQDRSQLAGLALLPMQAPGRAIDELHYAVNQLGLIGAYVGTRTTQELDSAAFDPLWGAFVELEVPLLLHPAPDAVDAPTSDPRLRRWDLDLIVGFPYDETLAVATLIYGGVLERHPELDVCISHGGGAAPYLYGRMAAAARTRPWSPEWLREEGAFERLLKRVWFDSHVHDSRALDLLANIVGDERIVFGSNFGGWDEGVVGTIDGLAAKVHSNTARLLRWDRDGETASA